MALGRLRVVPGANSNRRMKRVARSDDETAPVDRGAAGTDSEYGDQSPFRAPEPEPLLRRVLPVTGELTTYGAPRARRDLIAGVTVAALAIPSAMAYAEVAGLSPVSGL